MKPHLWTNPYEDRRLPIGSSDGGLIMVSDEGALLQYWCENRCKAEAGDIPGEPSPSQRSDSRGTKSFPNHVCAAHVEFIATLKGQHPRPIPLDVDAVDLEDRADHLNKAFNAFAIYLTAALEDTAQNVPGGLDLGDICAALSDIAADVTGTIQLSANAMAGRVA